MRMLSELSGEKADKFITGPGDTAIDKGTIVMLREAVGGIPKHDNYCRNHFVKRCVCMLINNKNNNYILVKVLILGCIVVVGSAV